MVGTVATMGTRSVRRRGLALLLAAVAAWPSSPGWLVGLSTGLLYSFLLLSERPAWRFWLSVLGFAVFGWLVVAVLFGAAAGSERVAGASPLSGGQAFPLRRSRTASPSGESLSGTTDRRRSVR